MKERSNYLKRQKTWKTHILNRPANGLAISLKNQTIHSTKVSGRYVAVKGSKLREPKVIPNPDILYLIQGGFWTLWGRKRISRNRKTEIRTSIGLSARCRTKEGTWLPAPKLAFGDLIGSRHPLSTEQRSLDIGSIRRLFVALKCWDREW